MAGEVGPDPSCLSGGGRAGRLSDGGWCFDRRFVPSDFTVISKELQLKCPGVQLFLRATTFDRFSLFNGHFPV